MFATNEKLEIIMERIVECHQDYFHDIENANKYLYDAKNASKARFNNATPYPGTRLFDMAKEEKNLKVIGDWENFHPTGALTSSNSFEWPIPYYPKGTTKEELIMDVIHANMLYYLQPKRMWKLVKASINRKGTKWLVLPPKWWMNIHYIKGIFKVLLLNMKRFMWLIKWKFQGKLLTQYKEKRP